MPTFIRSILTHLTFYVLLAIAAGVLLGHFNPALAIEMEPLGKWFIFLIKILTIPIIFLTVSLGISSMGDLKRVGIIGVKALIYFEIVTTLSLALGVIVALVARPGHIDRSGLATQDATRFTQKAGEAFSLWQFFFR